MSEDVNYRKQHQIQLADMGGGILVYDNSAFFPFGPNEGFGTEGLTAPRLSRLCSRALSSFQSALELLTRIGRPRRHKRDDTPCLENGILSSLLDVTTELLRHVSFRKPAIRALVVGAFLRLKQAHPELTRERLCQTLASSPRTFRYWMAHTDGAPTSSPVAAPPQNKPPSQVDTPFLGFLGTDHFA